MAKPLTVVEPVESPSVEGLFRAHAPELGRYLVAMVRDRALAEDLLQDTFQDALRSQEQLPRIENPRAWLYGIARHRALRALRGGRRLLRALVLLRHLHGFQAVELAEMTGLSPEAVRQRLSRAGARLLAAPNEKEAGR